MSITRLVARPLLSSTFVVGGLDAVRHPESKAKTAEPVAKRIAERVPGLPHDTETLVRLNGAAMLGAGILLALGKFRRLAAVALIGSILPTTFAGHRFWEESDDASRAQQQVHFLKNLGLLGGLILAAMDTEGQPSLGWRATHKAKRARRAVSVGKGRAGKRANAAAHHAVVNAEDLLAVLSQSTGRAAHTARKTAESASQSGGRAAKRARVAAEPVLSSGVNRVGESWSNVAEHLPVR